MPGERPVAFRQCGPGPVAADPIVDSTDQATLEIEAMLRQLAEQVVDMPHRQARRIQQDCGIALRKTESSSGTTQFLRTTMARGLASNC